MKLILFLILLLPQKMKADLFGGDIGVLVQIATTTIKQLNEMEKLVSNAEKYTEKVQHYNEMLNDKMIFARQVLFKLERLKSLDQNPKNLGDINRLIVSLKMQLQDIETIVANTSSDIIQSQDIQMEAAKIDGQAKKLIELSEQQKRLTQGVDKNVSINKANALNNAYSLEVNTLSLQVQTQNLHQNAKAAEYISKQYLENKLKEDQVHEFFLGKKSGARNELY